MKAAAWFRKQHALLSYFMLVPFLWIAATGTFLSALTFWKEATVPFHLPSSHVSYAEASALSQLNQVLASVDRQSRGADMTRVEFAIVTGTSLRARFELSEQWYFSPNAAEPFAKVEGRTQLDQLISTVTNLHRGRFADLPGQVVFSLIAIVLLLFSLTGVVIFKRRKVESTARSLHAWVGIMVAAPLITLFATGGIGNLSNQLRGTAALKGGRAGAINGDGWRGALVLAQKERPNSVVDGLFKVKTGIMAEFSDGGRIYFKIDSDTHVQIAEVYLPWTIKGWLEPWYGFHTGRIAGLFGRIVMGLTGLFSVLLFFAGLFLLTQRPFYRRIKKHLSR